MQGKYKIEQKENKYYLQGITSRWKLTNAEMTNNDIEIKRRRDGERFIQFGKERYFLNKTSTTQTNDNMQGLYNLVQYGKQSAIKYTAVFNNNHVIIIK